MQKTDKKKSGLSVKHWLGYMFGDFGGCMTFTLMASTFTLYCTDALGVDPLVLGTLVFIWTVWDAINDPLMGALMDKVFARHRNKNGKFRPWLLRATPLLAVTAIALWTAPTFFDGIPAIQRKLQTLYDVGLGYVKIGQSSTTLSGGEAQRVKLATELAKRATGRTVYILDEPTTGLHSADVAKLLEVLQRLCDAGNTVLVIEHNLDVIKSADWLIDLGPEGGDGGGTLVAEGTPEAVAEVKASHTGKYLRRWLKRNQSDTKSPEN